MRVVIVTDAGLVIGVQDLSGKTIDPDGRAARGTASYAVETPDGPEVVEYEAVVEAPPGCRFVASEDALPGWTWTAEGGCQPPEPELPTAAELKAYVRARRWDVENGGILVANVPIATDDRSKTMLIGSRLAAMAAPASYTTPWSAMDHTTHQFDAAQVIAVSDAVLAHVLACFNLQGSLLAAIEAGTVTTREAIDAAGWPANVT